ncbi:MAG TPA: TrkA family potassium uptake protein [Candidatus Bilamarchaeaceae archaeon]|nr:TrkA family potassium uptake protein [Candidatus Bilamarchaeaceae archaeon]
MRIIIFGAGRVGITLAGILVQRKYNITIIDEKQETCDILAGDMDCKVICGDATDPNLLDQMEMDDVDFVFSVTGNEEVNFLSSVYSKSTKARRVICRASEVKYSRLMERLGIEPLIPELSLGRELANIVMAPVISLMLDPSYSHIEMIEQDVKGKLENKTVGDVGSKKNFTIVSVFKDGTFLSPEPDLVLTKDMKIVVIKHKP